MLDTNDENLKETSVNDEVKITNAAHVSEENFDNSDSEIHDEDDADNEADYSNFTLKQLVDELKKLLDNHPSHTINKEVKAIKNAFSSQFSELLASKKESFLAEGGESIDFKFNSPEKIQFNQLMATFRSQRDTFYKNLEKELNLI